MRRPALLLALGSGLLAASGALAEAPSSGVYDANCSVCHQAAGAGAPGQFPRLAGRTGKLATSPKGRHAMIAAVLFGMSGKLPADNQIILGVMTPLPQLSDAEIAQVLSYVSHLDGGAAKPFSAAEVAAVRAGPKLTPTEVNALARDPTLQRLAP